MSIADRPAVEPGLEHPGILGSAMLLGASCSAYRTGLDQSTLAHNLRTLEAEGLIEIAVVETDLRRRAVSLTETGARRLEAAIPVWRRAHAKLAKCLSPELARRLAAAAEALIRERR